MKPSHAVAIVSRFAMSALLFSCAGAPDTAEETEPITVAETPVTPGTAVAPGSPPEETPVEPDREEEPSAPEKDVATEPFEVTEELYEQTFSEVERAIAQLNTVIQRRDYRRWLSYLTPEYVAHYSDPRTLEEISAMPILTRNEIVLRSLSDYFEWVVAPSRTNARLDDLRFLNPRQVEAIMNVHGRPAILYRLRNVDGSWKVDVF